MSSVRTARPSSKPQDKSMSAVATLAAVKTSQPIHTPRVSAITTKATAAG